MNLADYNIGGDNPQSCLFEGDSGTGKSIAANFWPGPIYNANCDGRMGSVAEFHRGRKDIEFDVFTDFDALDEKIESLIQHCPYKTIIVDPLTNISSQLIRYSFSLRGSVVYDESTGEAKKQSAGKKKGRVDVTTVEDFNVEYRGIEDVILNMKIIQKNHGCNIILICHLLTTTYTKPGGLESNIRRDIVTAGKKIVPFIPTQFDEVYNFHCEEGKWLVKTYNDGIVPARSSFMMMPKLIDWTNQNLYEKISRYYVPSDKKSEEV